MIGPGAHRREAFDLPRDVAYLDAAAYGPLSRSAAAAAGAALARRAAPWSLVKEELADHAEALRGRLAGLVGAAADSLALASSVSAAIGWAAARIAVAAGTRVLRLAGEHPSNALAWDRLAARAGAELEIVPRPQDRDWTRAVQAAVERPGARPLAVAALSAVHWSDAGRLDIARIAPLVRAAGGALVVDATHAAGAGDVDIGGWGADLVAFPLFKWLLGPYGLAAFHVGRRLAACEPFEASAFGCRLDAELGFAGFAPGARRFDRGERDDPVALAAALAALEERAAWGAGTGARIASAGRALAEQAAAGGFDVTPEPQRAPHMLSLRPRPGETVEELAEALRAGGVIASVRGGALRLSPHVYTDAEDVARFAAAIAPSGRRGAA